MTEILSYKSMSQFYAVFLIGTSLCALLGYFIVPAFMPALNWDWILISTVYVGLPVLLTALAYYYGWRYKKSVVIYTTPEWNYNPIMMSIDDAKNLPKAYNKENFRLVAYSKFWMFFMPVFLLVLIAAIPVYSFLEASDIIEYTPLIFSIAFAVLFSITLYCGFRSTSNAASHDFTLPLIREAVKLAEIQENIEGVSKVQIILDKAVNGEQVVYEQPRVLLRIREIENEGYIESWSDDLGAITKVLCRIYESNGKPQIVWWWISTDRIFRKYVYPDEIGYYVKNPLNSMITYPGVKDVKLVTQTAIALLVREFMKTRKETNTLREILVKINSDTI